MTHFATDRTQPGSGYWPSPWPVECGGNRRQKSAVGRLGAAEGTASVTTRRTARWDVMVVRREPGEWYVGGTMPLFPMMRISGHLLMVCIIGVSLLGPFIACLQWRSLTRFMFVVSLS